MTKPRDFFLTWFPHGFLYERVPFATASIVFFDSDREIATLYPAFYSLKAASPYVIRRLIPYFPDEF